MLGTAVSGPTVRRRFLYLVALIERVIDLVGPADVRTPDLDEAVTFGAKRFDLPGEILQRDADGGLLFIDRHVLSPAACRALSFICVAPVIFSRFSSRISSAFTTPSMIISGLAAHPGTYTSTGITLSTPPAML